MRKSRPQLLEEFTKHLFERDPMGICFPDNPDRETEYDGEALTILSRFVESHIIEMVEDAAQEAAYLIVQGAFEFWFSHSLRDEVKTRELSAGLLEILRSAYPEQEADPGVRSGNEERPGDGSGGLPGIAPDEASPRQGRPRLGR